MYFESSHFPQRHIFMWNCGSSFVNIYS